jgi:hypothetical protein
MSIYELHVQGGMLFMSILTILFIATIATGVLGLIKREDAKWLKISKETALLALVWGILGQVLGLFAAFQGIEQMGEVSQAMLAGGLKVSSYTTIYGLIIFIVGKVLQLVAGAITK